MLYKIKQVYCSDDRDDIGLDKWVEDLLIDNGFTISVGNNVSIELTTTEELNRMIGILKASDLFDHEALYFYDMPIIMDEDEITIHSTWIY